MATIAEQAAAIEQWQATRPEVRAVIITLVKREIARTLATSDNDRAVAWRLLLALAEPASDEQRFADIATARADRIERQWQKVHEVAARIMTHENYELEHLDFDAEHTAAAHPETVRALFLALVRARADASAAEQERSEAAAHAERAAVRKCIEEIEQLAESQEHVSVEKEQDAPAAAEEHAHEARLMRYRTIPALQKLLDSLSGS